MRVHPGRSRVFTTYRHAIRSYEPNSRHHASPYRVKVPPTARDFEAHGEFDGGELSFEAINQNRWGGSFGDQRGVTFAWATVRNIHNHPDIDYVYGAFPSRKDVSSVCHSAPEIVASRFGIVRFSMPVCPETMWFWPERMRADLLARDRRGRTLALRRTIPHPYYGDVVEMNTSLLQVLQRLRSGVLPSDSFFLKRFPVGYTGPSASFPSHRMKIAFGEIAFISWRDFRDHFKLFGRDPFTMLNPYVSWGRLFGESER